MQINKLSGATMAAAAAMLFTSALPTASFAADDAATVHCAGVNACKGMSECKSSKNSCKGMNSCKGKGWTAMTKEACKEAKEKATAK